MHADLESQRTFMRPLRDLPEAAAPYAWAEFQRRRARPAARTARRLLGGGALAAAAVVLIASAALGVRIAGPGSRTAAPEPGAPSGASVWRVTPAEPPELRAAEAGATRWLASLPTEPAIVRVGTRAAVITLEDRIAQVDDLLSAQRADRAPAAHLLALQQQRLQLVDSLAQVRYAETLADESR